MFLFFTLYTPKVPALVSASALALAVAACSGSAAHTPDTGVTISAACAAGKPVSGASVIRRMTHFEYDNTIRDLFGEDDHPSQSFPPDERAALFDNDAVAQSVDRFLAEKYMTAAEQIAANAVAQLSTSFPCNAGESEDACATRFIATVGARIFRRPLASDETADLFAAFSADRATADFATGIRTVLEVLLQSPEFLYRVELGQRADPAVAPGAGSVPVTPWELASRLSYLLWGSLPDDALTVAAAGGKLTTHDDVRAQVARMLTDPRARAVTDHFYEQWLQLDKLDYLEKDINIYPTFDPALRALFRSETLAFTGNVTWNDDGLLSTLLTAPYTFMNGKLAAFYGASNVAGSAFQKVQLDPTRSGLLTQGSLLATLAKFDQTSPVHRGKFVREGLLCMPMPPPPANVQIEPPALNPRLTTRERFAAHSSSPACVNCHKLIDPIGLGFESFDGVGLHRVAEGDLPINDEGELTASDVDGVFHGVPELASHLAASAQVERCMVLQWFRYGYGRDETADDACTLDVLASSLAKAHGNLRSLLAALTETNAFLFKTTGQEPTP